MGVVAAAPGLGAEGIGVGVQMQWWSNEGGSDSDSGNATRVSGSESERRGAWEKVLQIDQ